MKATPIIGLAAAAMAVGYYFTQGAGQVESLFGNRSHTSNTAQVDTNTPPPTPAAPATTAPAGSAETDAQQANRPKVDETALRYFARRGDTKRMEAEIARLRALYPDWTPPSDPLAIVPQGDAKLDEMWKLYSEGRYAELRKAIADRSTAEPDWRVPNDLLDRLAIAESRERLINASNVKQYETVIRVASETPSLLTCGELDVLWRVAEAFALTDRAGRAKDAYLYILNNCDGAAERVATVEKAIPLLPRADLDELLATEKKAPDGQGEFAKARVDLARRSLADAGDDPKKTVLATDVDLVEAAAEKEGLPKDASLLGWYYIGRKDFTAAEKWFRKFYESEDSADSAQGLALALIGLGRYAEAEDRLYPWQDKNPDALKVYLAAVANLLAGDPPTLVEPNLLQRMAAVVAQAHDTPSAQQFGWYARALRQHRTAAQWFTQALTWTPDDEPSAYGLALSRLQLRDRAGVLEIQRLWAGRSERIAILGETRKRPAKALETVPGPRAPLTAADGTPAPDPTETAALGRATPEPESRTVPDRVEPRRAPEPVYIDRATESGDEVAAAPMRPRATGGVAQRVERLPQRRSCSGSRSGSNLNGEASLARGWCLMDLNRPVEAAAAFKQAYERGGADVQRDAAWGQSLALLRNGLVDEAAVAATKAPQDGKRSVELEEALLTRRATDFFQAGRYVESLLALDQRARIAPERLDLMAMRGYAYLNIGRKRDARRVFQALADVGHRDGMKGLRAVDPPKDNN